MLLIHYRQQPGRDYSLAVFLPAAFEVILPPVFCPMGFDSLPPESG